MKETVEKTEKSMTLKKKILINVLVNLGVAVLFFAIYQIAVLKNINIFGIAATDGRIIPEGFSVQKVFLIVGVINIIAVTVFWVIQKLNIKLLPMLLVAVLVPIITYNVNYSIFINGSGAVYKEKQSIVMGLKKAEKEYKKSGESAHLKRLEDYPIFLTDYDNGDFKTYLYINEALDEIYVFNKPDDDSKVSYNDATIYAYHYVSGHAEEAVTKTVDINRDGVESIKILEDSLYVFNLDGTTRMFKCGNCGWLMDADGRPNENS